LSDSNLRHGVPLDAVLTESNMNYEEGEKWKEKLKNRLKHQNFEYFVVTFR
jgi:hypothetical protein